MKKFYPLATIMSLAAMLPTYALAHPGHDHSADSANLIHLLWAAPVLVAAVVAYKLLKSTMAKKTSVTGND